MAWRIIEGVLGIVVLGLVAIPCWIQIHRTDMGAPPDDADLHLARSTVSARENGYRELRTAARIMTWPVDEVCCFDTRIQDFRDGKGPLPEELPALLVENRKALDALERATRARVIQLPTPPRWPRSIDEKENEALQTSLQIMRLVRLQSTIALSERGRRDPRELIDSMMLGLRLGRRFSQAEGLDLVLLMMAVSYQSIATADIAATIPLLPLDRTNARALIALLEANRISTDAWSRAWANEYQGARAALVELSKSDAAMFNDEAFVGLGKWLNIVPRDYLLHTNRTLQEIAEHHRDRQRRVVLDCTHATAGRETLPISPAEITQLLLAPNPVGNVLATAASRFDGRWDFKRCHADSKIGLLQVQVAAKAHWDATGSLPESLDALVPELLDEIPRDPFDGALLRYWRANASVHSIGEDFTLVDEPLDPALTHWHEPSISVRF